MNINLDRKFPSVPYMREHARKRIPRFAWDYLSCAIGLHQSMQHNRDSLDQVKLIPRYIVDHADKPDLSCKLLGKIYDMPFGVAPVGLGGLIWPRAAEYLAKSARDRNVPFCLSSFATASIQDIADIGGENAWYQHYMFADESLNEILFKRALDHGYKNLIITVDIPTATRRAHDIRNGLSVPPRLRLQTVMDSMKRPRWCLETLSEGLPRFKNVLEFAPENANLEQLGMFIQDMIEGHVSLERLKRVRDFWPHNLIVKGILDPEDVRSCMDLGVDAIVVSNHGGRQLDAAHSAIERLPDIRNLVGPKFPLIADGGITSGLDVVRYLANGADFVLAGRAFMYAIGAMGQPGAAQIMHVLSEETRIALSQIGASDTHNLNRFLGAAIETDG